MVISLQITPIILCAVIVAQEKDTQEKIKQLSPYFGIAFTIISFIAAFFPSGSINGGYLATDNGLNYQSNSYLAAYASACSYYYLLNFKTFQWRGFFRKRIAYNIVLASIVVNLLSIFVSGGRGGLVLFVCQTLMAIWFLIKNKNSYRIKSIYIFAGVCVIAGILIFAIHFAETSSLKTNGFERIVATVETGDSNGRDILREKALNAFEKSPIVGHGIGSVFNEIGEYSHNCITDSLVEGGLIGTIIYVLVIGVAFFKLYKRARLHNDEYIWLTFIVNGLILSLFSGYYLTQLPICWSTAFAYSLTAINNNKFRLNVRQHQL